VLYNLQTVDGTYVVNQSTMLSYLLLYLNCEENIEFTEIMCIYKGIMFSHLIMHKKKKLFIIMSLVSLISYKVQCGFWMLSFEV